MSNEDRSRVEAGDMKTLKKVLEAEIAKADTSLRENADANNFRLYQGMAQAFLAVKKLLP